MDWTNETVLRFLELYEMNPCIWDPKHKSHKNKNRIEDAWIDIKNNMGVRCTIKELKKKKESLMSAYRGYRTRIRKSEILGAGTGDVYRPTWFAFQCMDNFLGPIYKCNPSMNTESEDNQQDAEDADTDQNETAYTIKSSHLKRGSSSLAPTQRESPSGQRFRRRRHEPPELQEAKKHLDQAFDIFKTISQQQHNSDDEDECQIYGKLISKRLSKLSENRRDLLMLKINEVLYTEMQEYNSQNDSSTIEIPYKNDNYE